MDFTLTKGDYTYFVAFKCVDRYPQYKINFVVEIRNNIVEDIANKFTQANPNYFKYSATAIVPFNYFKQRRWEFVVTTERDMEEIRNSFCPFYKQVVHPFLEKHSSLENLSSFIAHIIREANQYMPITINTYRRNIILFKLTNNSDFENRANQIRRIIAEFPDNDKQNFEDTYAYLKTL
jgi:hypothetical protein